MWTDIFSNAGLFSVMWSLFSNVEGYQDSRENNPPHYSASSTLMMIALHITSRLPSTLLPTLYITSRQPSTFIRIFHIIDDSPPHHFKNSLLHYSAPSRYITNNPPHYCAPSTLFQDSPPHSSTSFISLMIALHIISRQPSTLLRTLHVYITT